MVHRCRAALCSRRGETLVEVLTAFALLLLFLSGFAASLHTAAALQQRAADTRARGRRLHHGAAPAVRRAARCAGRQRRVCVPGPGRGGGFHGRGCPARDGHCPGRSGGGQALYLPPLRRPRTVNRPPVLQRRGGATLVELLICLALLGALCALAAALVHPFAVQYARNPGRFPRADDRRYHCGRAARRSFQARGTLRLADAAQTAGEAGQVFAPAADPEGRSGAALEFGIPGGYFLLLDAGAVPQTALPQGGSVPEQAAGTLHRRYYAAVSEPGQGDSYVYHGPGGYVADGYADAFAGGFIWAMRWRCALRCRARPPARRAKPA